MSKKRKSAEPKEIVPRNAKEVAAVELYWQTGEFPNLRKPQKNYKYIDELYARASGFGLGRVAWITESSEFEPPIPLRPVQAGRSGRMPLPRGIWRGPSRYAPCGNFAGYGFGHAGRLMHCRTDKWRGEFMKYGNHLSVWGRAAFADSLDPICFCQPIELDEEANASASVEFCLG